MFSDNELITHFTIAREYVETHTSETVWRTSQRIYELIRLHCPFWKQNEALADEVKFSTLLYSFCYEGEMGAHTLPELAGERYEEGHHEAIFFSDTQFPTRKSLSGASIPGVVPPFLRQNVRAIIVQRELARLMRAGYDYKQATDQVHKLDPSIRAAYVDIFREKGMLPGNMYYKKRNSSNKELPRVPGSNKPEILVF